MDANIITIWGKSGAGKTTLAVNLACALAEHSCVGLISANLQYGHLQSFFGQEVADNRGLLTALQDPGKTKDCFVPAGNGLMNLFLLSVPHGYTGLQADTISQADVEAVLDRVRSATFDILIVDGSENITNPVSSVAISQSKQIITVHKPTVASGLWFRSMGDFIFQLHLEEKLLHIVQETPFGIQPHEYLSAMRLNADIELPHVPDALRLEDSGTPIVLESNKICRRYKKEIQQLIQVLHNKHS